MAFIPVANTAEVSILMLLDNQQIENTLWFEFPSNPDTAMLEDLCQAVIDWWTAEIAPYLSFEVSLRGVRAVSMNSSTAPTAELTPASPVTGGINSSSQPGNVAWSVQFKTAARGRSARGRNYIPGIPASQLASMNTVASAWATNIVNGYLEILGTTYDFGADWVITSRFSGGSPRSSGVNTQVTSVSYADLYVDSQRRRLPGRGG